MVKFKSSLKLYFDNAQNQNLYLPGHKQIYTLIDQINC